MELLSQLIVVITSLYEQFTFMHAIQTVFAGGSILLTQLSNKECQRYACIVGIIGQPFCLYAMFVAGELGMLVVALLVTFGWFIGIKNYWIKPWLAGYAKGSNEPLQQE
jgi:hypothetical protein